MMQLLSGIHQLKTLSDVVSRQGSPYPGKEITEKLQEILLSIKESFESGEREWNFQASLNHDATNLFTAILQLANVSNWEELKKSTTLWPNDDQFNRERFQQALATLMNIAEFKNRFQFPFYHTDLLQLAAGNLSTREAVREAAEERLKKAYSEDSKGHFLLRDSSSEVLDVPGFRFFVASIIASCGKKITHLPISYRLSSNKWIVNKTGVKCKNLNALMNHVAGETVKGIHPFEVKSDGSY